MIVDILWEKQKQAVEFIVDRRRVLLADQPGSGKTLMSLAALEADGCFTNGLVLILAPKFPARTTWLKDHVMKYVAPTGVNVYDLTSGTAEAKNDRLLEVQTPAVVVANHDSLAISPNGERRVPRLFDHTYDAIIIDESHRVLPTDADARYDMTQFWRGLSRLSIHSQALRIAVSGTPDRSKLENRYGTLKFLFPEVYTNHKHWMFTNFIMESRTIRLPGGRTKDIVVPQQLRSPLEWVARDQLYLVRRTKAEIQEGRPAKQYINVTLDMAKPQRKAYMDLMKDHFSGNSKMTPAVVALRSRQLAISSGWDFDNNQIGDSFSSTKFEWLVEWLEARGYMDQSPQDGPPSKVVVASSFVATLQWIKRELAKLGVTAEILDGSTSQTERARIQAEFQDHQSSLRVVLISMNMGVGIDLDAADDLVFFDVPYSSDDAEQVEDRIDRLSRIHRVTIWWLLSNDSIDLAIAGENTERFQVSRELLDGSRGVEFARQILAQLRR
ncbi:MAG: DEAD/DEAH box helicase [Actinobacteria bacterium]|nr:DEAD/DEAH box helicase [Actinomycetota bacterium]